MITRDYQMPSNSDSYYDLMLGPHPRSFLSLFQHHWKEHLNTFPQRYRPAKQLVIGSRLRPLLVAWGYLISGSEFDDSKRSEVAEIAVYIELLHKATLLIDDLIDQDALRNGEQSFHIEYTASEAIIFGIYLFGDCVEKLSTSTTRAHAEGWYPDVIEHLGRTLKAMCVGVIEELVSPVDELSTLAKAKEIIELQTIALIKNGMLTGYKYGRGDAHHQDAVESLGYDCGYLFQVLNDLEPFLGTELNAVHKGSVNFDAFRSRKNMMIGFLWERLSEAERTHLHQMLQSADPLTLSTVIEWLVRQDVLAAIFENLTDVRKNIEATTSALHLDAERQSSFLAFINYVLSIAVTRIGGVYGEKLSVILIR